MSQPETTDIDRLGLVFGIITGIGSVGLFARFQYGMGPLATVVFIVMFLCGLLYPLAGKSE